MSSDKTTQVFVSDIHMSDDGAGGAVSDHELTAFLDHLKPWTAAGVVRLVLLGDIIDLLRSPLWEAVWNQKKGAPWSAMAPDFVNFVGSDAEQCALAVLRSVRSRYPLFAATLKGLAASGQVVATYVCGNHDFMFQVSALLRRELFDFLSLSGDPDKPLAVTYTDAASSVYAMHGHTFDEVNYHRTPEGHWAFGDAIVLRVVNRFQSEACGALGCGPNTEIGRQLADIDNIEPMADIPIYVRWLAEQLTVEHQQKQVLAAWNRIVGEFLAVPDFKDKAYDLAGVQSTRRGLELSTHLGLAELVARYSEPLLKRFEIDYAAHASKIAASLPYRFVVFGHTHAPGVTPLMVRSGKPSFYVNTGSWRRIVARPRDSAGPFIATRMTGYFVVLPDEATPGGRYRLRREWWTT